MMTNFTSPEAAPEHLREYARKVEAMALKVIEVINGLNEPDTSVVLDVLLNVYVNAGHSFGRELECAHRMVQIGGQMLLRDALQQQLTAASAEPAAPGPLH